MIDLHKTRELVSITKQMENLSKKRTEYELAAALLETNDERILKTVVDLTISLTNTECHSFSSYGLTKDNTKISFGNTNKTILLKMINTELTEIDNKYNKLLLSLKEHVKAFEKHLESVEEDNG